MYFSDSKGNKIEPEQLGIELEAIDDAHNVILFEDIGNGQTKLTFIGNRKPCRTQSRAGNARGLSGATRETCCVVAGLAQSEIRR